LSRRAVPYAQQQKPEHQHENQHQPGNVHQNKDHDRTALSLPRFLRRFDDLSLSIHLRHYILMISMRGPRRENAVPRLT
jgi:hypothetical protein